MLRPAGIDVVYTWVDGARPDYVELVRRHAGASRDLNPERFRDATLRHSLRSLEQHAPWVRHIYLFTCRPQMPAWLRRDHPRLRIVHHDEVVTEPGVLPMFNSNVIECFLHRLPGLSDHFLYFNDDHFLGAPTRAEDFYTDDGRIRIFGTLCGERLPWRIREHQWISLGLLEHTPVLIDRQAWGEMQATLGPRLAAFQSHRFRQPDDLRCDRLYRWFMLTHARERCAAEPCWRLLRYSTFHKVRSDPHREQTALARLARRRPRFFCLNDDQGARPHPGVTQLVRRFLDELWPQPSSFERPGE